MNLQSSPEGSSGRRGAGLMLITVLLTSGVAATVAASAVLPAGASSTTTAQQKKPRPTASVSPTSGSTATVSQPTGATPAPTATASPSPGPVTACTSEATVTFEGALYCPGLIVGVQSGVYGVPGRVVLLGVTVVDVSGPMVYIMGGPACLPDPTSQEPQYCAATVKGMAVNFSGADSLPTPGTGVDLFGVTEPGGSITPEGFVTVAWCDPTTCP